MSKFCVDYSDNNPLKYLTKLKEEVYEYDFDVNYEMSGFNEADKRMQLRQLINAAFSLRASLRSRIKVYTVTEEELMDAASGSSLSHKKEAVKLYFDLG